MSDKKAQDMTLKEALQQLVNPQSTPDDLVESCKCLTRKDYAAMAANQSATTRAIRLVALPRLLDLIADPPEGSQRAVDAENWVVFWAVRAVEEVVPACGLEVEAVRMGLVGCLVERADVDVPETCCVILKALSLVSAGYCLGSPSSDDPSDGASDDPSDDPSDGASDDNEYVSKDGTLEHYSQAISKVTSILQHQRGTKRASRHPFLLPLAAYALAFLATNAPADYSVEWVETCRLFAALLKENQTDCAEAILILAESMVKGSEEASGAALSSGFLHCVLSHIARGDFQGDLATQSFTLLSAICDSVPKGAQLLRDIKGIRALAKTLTDLREPAEQQAALKVALVMLDLGGGEGEGEGEGEEGEGKDGETLEKAVNDGLVVEAFLCLTEAKDLPTRQAALDVIDKVIRAAPPKLYNAMKIDPYFVLTILSMARKGPEPGQLEFGRQCASLVIWMARNQRCDMDALCSTGNLSTATRIKEGMHGMTLAKLIKDKLAAEKERERALQARAASASAAASATENVDEKASGNPNIEGTDQGQIEPSAEPPAKEPIATA